MRSVLVIFSLVLACSQKQYIGPDSDGGHDGSTPLPDGAVVTDASPDGSSTTDGGDEGGTPKAKQGYVSGSRLRARYYLGSDGSEQRIGFYDNVRKEDCTFIPGSDGVTRCLPLSNGASLAGIFSDSACTSPIALVAKGCTAPTSVLQYFTVTSCGIVYRYRAMSMSTSFSGSSAYTLSGTTCIVYPSGSITTLKATYDLYTVGSEVAPSSFVDATTKTE